MSLSQTKRAIEAREWRVGLRQRRRFNTLLNGYIDVKYKKIYGEYKQFFHMLNQEHPEARDLTRTKSYKKWRKEYLANKEVGEGDDERAEEDFQPDTNEGIQSNEDERAEEDFQPDTNEGIQSNEDERAEEDFQPDTNEGIQSNEDERAEEDFQPDTNEGIQSNEDERAEEDFQPHTNEGIQSNEDERAEEDFQPHTNEGIQSNDNEIDILSVAVEEILPQNSINVNDVDSIITTAR